MDLRRDGEYNGSMKVRMKSARCCCDTLTPIPNATWAKFYAPTAAGDVYALRRKDFATDPAYPFPSLDTTDLGYGGTSHLMTLADDGSSIHDNMWLFEARVGGTGGVISSNDPETYSRLHFSGSTADISDPRSALLAGLIEVSWVPQSHIFPPGFGPGEFSHADQIDEIYNNVPFNNPTTGPLLTTNHDQTISMDLQPLIDDWVLTTESRLWLLVRNLGIGNSNICEIYAPQNSTSVSHLDDVQPVTGGALIFTQVKV